MKPDNYLIPSTSANKDKHLSRVQVYRVFKKTASNLGLEGTISPHSCRKNYAREHYKENRNIYTLMRELNHASVGTTIGYLMDLEMIKI